MLARSSSKVQHPKRLAPWWSSSMPSCATKWLESMRRENWWGVSWWDAGVPSSSFSSNHQGPGAEAPGLAEASATEVRSALWFGFGRNSRDCSGARWLGICNNGLPPCQYGLHANGAGPTCSLCCWPGHDPCWCENGSTLADEGHCCERHPISGPVEGWHLPWHWCEHSLRCEAHYGCPCLHKEVLGGAGLRLGAVWCQLVSYASGFRDLSATWEHRVCHLPCALARPHWLWPNTCLHRASRYGWASPSGWHGQWPHVTGCSHVGTGICMWAPASCMKSRVSTVGNGSFLTQGFYIILATILIFGYFCPTILSHTQFMQCCRRLTTTHSRPLSEPFVVSLQA